MSESSFYDAGYEVPQGASNYMKLVPGANKLRILSRPKVGWEYFNPDNKPVRIEGAPQPMVDKALIKMDKYGKQDLKHIHAFVVWNYASKEIQVLTVGQSSIQGRIKELSESADWGSPFAYDLTINKSGSGKETEYTVTPTPPKPLSDEAKEAYKAKPCNLSVLFAGGDPFAKQGSVPVPAPTATPTPVAQVVAPIVTQATSVMPPDDLPF